MEVCGREVVLADLSDIVSTLKREVSVLRNDIHCMKAASLIVFVCWSRGRQKPWRE